MAYYHHRYGFNFGRANCSLWFWGNKVNVANAGPIIASRENRVNHRGVSGKCLACGGRVERYAMDLGTCQSCGAEFFMWREGRHKVRCKYIPRAV